MTNVIQSLIPLEIPHVRSVHIFILIHVDWILFSQGRSYLYIFIQFFVLIVNHAIEIYSSLDKFLAIIS